MSSPETTPTPSPQQPQNRATRIMLLICAPIVMVLGIWQMVRGINQMSGSGPDPQVKALIDQSNQAFTTANKLTATIEPDFEDLINSVDKLGLDTARKQKQGAAKTLGDQYGQATAGFRQAATKLSDALKLKLDDKLKAYLEGLSKAYELYAQVCDMYQQMIVAVMDPSIAKIDDLLPKVKQLTAQRDSLQKQADDTATEANQNYGVATPAAKP